MSYTKQRTVLFIAVLLLIIGGVLVVFTEPAFAEENWDTNTKDNKANIIMDFMGQYTLELDKGAKVTQIVVQMFYILSGVLFALALVMAMLATFLMNLALDMPFLSDIADKLHTIISVPGSRLFETDGSSEIMLIGIAITMVGVVYAFMRMRMTEGVSKLLKIVAIVFIAGVLLNRGVDIFLTINDASTEISESAVEQLTDAESSEEAIWNMCIVKPWALLNFGEAKSQNYGQDVEYKKNESLTENEPYYNTALGYLKDSNPQNDFARKMIFMDAKERNKATETVMEENPKNLMVADMGTQIKRTGFTLILCLISAIISITAAALSLLIIAAKLMSLILFFLWPICMVFSLVSTEGLQIMKRWISVVVMVFLASVVVQFVFAIMLSMIDIVMGNATTLPGLLASLLVTVAIIVAIRFGFRPFMMIVSPQGFRKVNTELRQMAMYRAMKNGMHHPGYGENHGGGKNRDKGDGKDGDEDKTTAPLKAPEQRYDDKHRPGIPQPVEKLKEKLDERKAAKEESKLGQLNNGDDDGGKGGMKPPQGDKPDPNLEKGEKGEKGGKEPKPINNDHATEQAKSVAEEKKKDAERPGAEIKTEQGKGKDSITPKDAADKLAAGKPPASGPTEKGQPIRGGGSTNAQTRDALLKNEQRARHQNRNQNQGGAKGGKAPANVHRAGNTGSNSAGKKTAK